MLKLVKVAGPSAIGFSLVTLLATAAFAEPVRQDRPEHGKVIVCAAQGQVQLPTGDMSNVMAELEGADYACTVEPARLVVVLNADRTEQAR